MKTRHDFETRVLEFLEGDLTPEEERELLAEAERSPDLAALLQKYRDQEATLGRAFAAHGARADAAPMPPLPAQRAGAKIVSVGTPRRRVGYWPLAAAASLAIAAGSVWYGFQSSPSPAILATVASDSGRPVQIVGSDGPVSLRPGSLISRTGSVLKTPDGTRAQIQLASNGGARMEMNGNSTVTLTARRNQSSVTLDRGELLIWGDDADERAHKTVTITTEGLEVSGRGAVFSVARGLGGAEVAVIEGEVELRTGGLVRKLKAGELFSTTDSRPLPIADRIAWSERRDELKHLIDLTVVAEPASTTGNASLEELVRYLPESTYTFVASDDLGAVLKDVGTPKLSDALSPANLERLHEALRVSAPGPSIEAGFTALNALVRDPDIPPFLDQLNGDFVVSVHRDGLLILGAVGGDQAAAQRIVREKLSPALAEASTDRPLGARLVNRWLLLGSQGETFDTVADGVAEDRASTFGNSDFFRSVSRATRSGSFTVGMDAQMLLAQAARHNAAIVPGLNQLGFGSVGSLVASNGFTDQADNRALRVTFNGEREGIFRWLGAPAPLGTTQVMAPNTWFYLGMRTDRPADILTDVLRLVDAPDAVSSVTSAALKDLAESLGNEVGLGIARPMIPMPKARLAIEVTDPARFHRALLTLLTSIDTARTLRVEQSESRGRPIIRFDHPGTSLPIAVGIVRDQAVFTIGQAALEEAWDEAARGESLAQNPEFLASLPAKSGTHASLVLYHQPESQGNELGALMQLVGASQPGQTQTFGKPPALLYAVAEDGRIDLYGEGIRNNWDVGRMITGGAGAMAATPR
ncbi:hypothetical protein GC173_10930 [bacterium]|nr:hypothetical protein [bacterium]